MKISELPEKIKKRALELQKIYFENLKKDDLSCAFVWRDTKEGHDYWDNLYYQDFRPTFTDMESYAFYSSNNEKPVNAKLWLKTIKNK